MAGITRTLHGRLKSEIGYGIGKLWQGSKSVLNKFCD
jgi:hypothetical protein